MKVPPKVTIGGSVLVIAVAVILLTRSVAERRVSLPEEHYVCGSADCGHAWTEKLTHGPVCPECGSAGAKEARYTCGQCQHTFTAWYNRRVAVGKYEVLLPNQTEWTARPPARLKCPSCGLVDRLGEGAFKPAGVKARNPAGGDA